jgi:hypothetical protein
MKMLPQQNPGSPCMPPPPLTSLNNPTYALALASPTLAAWEPFFSSFRFSVWFGGARVPAFGGGLGHDGRVVAVEGGGARLEDRRRWLLWKVTYFLEMHLPRKPLFYWRSDLDCLMIVPKYILSFLFTWSSSGWVIFVLWGSSASHTLWKWCDVRNKDRAMSIISTEVRLTPFYVSCLCCLLVLCVLVDLNWIGCD